MATTAITSKFLNQDKRENEAVTVTLPAILNEGGGRTNAAPTYVQFEDTYTAAVAPKESVIGKSYLIVEEAFLAATTVNISIGGTALFTEALVDATGLFVSAVEDTLLLTGGDVSINVSSTLDANSGDATIGKLKLVSNYVPYTVKNGRFSEVPA